MKTLIFILSTLASSTVYSNNSLEVFDSKLRLTPLCEIEHVHKGELVKVGFRFSEANSCKIVTHSKTSIPNTHYINGFYILFIESNIFTEDNCTSEYTAIGVDRDNNLLTTNIIKKSGRCNQGRDLKSFEYFSHKLQKNH